jgi:twinkle protein
MGEWQDFCGRLIGWLADSAFRLLPESVISKWAEWCRSRFAFISRDSGDEAPTLDWLMDTYRSCVLRDGVTDCLLDPWNQIAHQRGALSETDYIDSALLQWSAFGRRHGCNIWVVAHPTKLRGAKPGDPLPVPNAYDISGSSAWFNKADMILTVYRTNGLTQVHLQKAKFERWSLAGAGDATRTVFAELEYVRQTGRYKSFCEGETEAPRSRFSD